MRINIFLGQIVLDDIGGITFIINIIDPIEKKRTTDKICMSAHFMGAWTHAGLGAATSDIFPGRCPANQPSNLANDVTTKCYFQPLISEALQ